MGKDRRGSFKLLTSKTSQFKTACKDDKSYVAQLNQKKNQKGYITRQHIAIESMCWQVILISLFQRYSLATFAYDFVVKQL